MSFLFWILLLLFHTELYDFFLFLFLPQSFGQAVQEYVHSLVILIFLYCIKGALPPLKWSCLLPSPFSLSPSQPFTLLKIFKNFMSFSQVAFKNSFHMLKASLWFVQKTFAGAFLDALSTEFSIQLLPLSLHFKVFPHLHSVLTCLSFPFFYQTPSPDIPFLLLLQTYQIHFPFFFIFLILLWFFVDDQITCPSTLESKTMDTSEDCGKLKFTGMNKRRIPTISHNCACFWCCQAKKITLFFLHER